jgi:peptidoglycan/LPS O-acetylase OafA/YrhL
VAHAGGRAALPYVAAFDGLRALAVLAVVAYHASLSQAPGGFFGVDVFFVISGYLVTVLFLVRTSPATPGGIGIPDAAGTRDFWRRRLLRLVPASVAAVAVTWLVFALLEVRAPGTLTAEAVSSLGYVANWFFLASDQSYFETIATPSPFLHFWSLAVEAQFYLVWPILLIGALRFGGRLAAFALALSLAAISTLVVAGLYNPTADPSRAYYGTDARVAGLLLGAALAIVVRPALAARAPRVPVEAVGWAGVVVLVLLVTGTSEYDPFIYRGGFFVAATASLAVLFAALHQRNTIAEVLATQPLRWLGERAYSIYLWHWPVFVLSQPQLSADLQSPSLLLARLGATLILAELSFRLVENRFRGGRASWTLPRLELGAGPYWQRPWARPAAVMGVGMVAIVIAGGLPVRTGLAGQMSEVSRQFQVEQARELTAATRLAAGDVDPTGGRLADLALRAAATMHTTGPSGVGTTSSLPVGVSTVTASLREAATATPGALPGAQAEVVPEPAAAVTSVSPGAEARASAVVSSASVTDTPYEAPAHLPAEIPAAIPAEVPAEARATGAPDAAILGASVTVIGDSVALGALDTLASALPGAVVDAEVGRQFWGVAAVITELEQQGALGEVVVLHLGSNGPFTTQQFEAIVGLLEGRTVVFVNVTVPRRWEADVNRALVSKIEGLPGVSLADWHTLSRSTAEYFSADGVHLTSVGERAYAALIAEAVAAAIASRDVARD